MECKRNNNNNSNSCSWVLCFLTYRHLQTLRVSKTSSVWAICFSYIVSNDLDKNLVHLRHQASRAKRLGKDKWDSGYHCLLLCFDSLYPVHSKVIYNITVKMLYMCDMLRQLIDPCILEPWLCIYIQSNNLLNHTLRTASKVAGLY